MTGGTAHRHTRVVLALLLASGSVLPVCAAPASGALGPAEPGSASAADVCATVTDIPLAECSALVDLYDSAGGPGWVGWANWLTGPTACNWFGITCASGHVSMIQMSGNWMWGTLPPTLVNLTHLRQLVLAGNGLTGNIPPWLGYMPLLQLLDLNSNQFYGSLPPSLGSAPSLTKLSIARNALGGALPRSLMNLSLTNFYFEGTGLCEPPDDAFQNWLSSIAFLKRTGYKCAVPPSLTLPLVMRSP
jgi:hypothetical protein